MNDIADHVSTQVSPVATLDLQRCQFSFADGRRCRTPRWEAHPALCISHARAGCGLHLQPTKKEPNTKSQPPAVPNLAGDLAPLSGEFRTATDVNRALGRLFSLLAQNRIPRRNAVALGYLAQLLLQTLPGVRDEITHCLGYEAWDETLESVFGQAKTEDETEEAEIEDEPEEDCEAPLIDSGHAETASERPRGLVSPVHELPIEEKKTVPATTEPELVPLLVVAAPAHQAEIAPEPEPEEFVPHLPGHWSYWKELEQNEHLRKMRT
jgi:hypothetical protein